MADDTPHIALIGLPGAGKSSVSRELATRLGYDCVSLDERIEAEAGMSIAEIFASEGEEHFRKFESALLDQTLSGDEPLVIDTGGGIVESPLNRKMLLSAEVYWLAPSLDQIVCRLTQSAANSPQAIRPLLDSDPEQQVRVLHERRAGLYLISADHVLDNSDDTPAEAARRIADLHKSSSGEIVETVSTATQDYPVFVGRGVLRHLTGLIGPNVRKIAVISQRDRPNNNVSDGAARGNGASNGTAPVNEVPNRVIEQLAGLGCDVRGFEVPDGESAKSLGTYGELMSDLVDFGLTRADLIVTVGGGVVSDLGGFVAATYHRGIGVIHVSTTLLGQVDAAIGGKCGVNLSQGKNLVGAFWQPSAVICDINSLATLPNREVGSGCGELAKYHFLGLDDGTSSLDIRVAAAVRIKGSIVAEDEREGGRRALLNYGHTLAHALETVGNYELRHGEAVAVGLIFAAELANRLGRIDSKRVQLHYDIVRSYGLPTRVPKGYDPNLLVKVMRRDKKALDGMVFILDGPNGPEVVGVSDASLIEAVIAEISER